MIKRTNFIFLALFVVVVVFFITHLIIGQIPITFSDYWNAIFHFDASNTNHLIALEFRIPRAIIAVIAGAGLSVAGMFMQTIFNNPLAGPYVLGINTGSSLVVAASMMTGISFLQTDIGIIGSAMIGALAFGFIILFFSIFVRSHVALLLIGLMLGSFASAIISILQTTSSAQELKAFTIWTMGSLQQVELSQLPLISGLFFGTLLLSIFIVKPLNVLVLGERSSGILGINVRTTRLFTILLTALLTGSVTAFCGPIAFVGLAIPNLTRALFKTQHHGKLLIGNLLLGALFLLVADSCIQLAEPIVQLPINAFTSILGAPFIIYIVLKRLK